ncbi:hypothetical protein CRUP_026087 [Coryphaenoides rupestris]|nr:hypothetical protein CRUP_026087 [Coryphaenoides rupestris]
MSSLSPEVALHRVSPELRPLLCAVVRNGRSLISRRGDIIFNARYPELPPDFIFGEDAEFIPEPSELPHLVQWDAADPECLLRLVKELIQQYHHFQCSRLRESSRLLFEYDSLLEEPSYGRNMEVYAGRKNSWTGEFSARFLLKLPVDFSNIPVYLLKDTTLDPGEDVALLSVSFEDAEATQVFPKLYLSPSIEHALGGTSALHIPGFPSGGCLIDYVPQVCQLLTNKGGVDLPLYFPRDQPTLTFQSVYHFTSSGQLYSQVQKSYPYSPRWDGNEMAKRAKTQHKDLCVCVCVCVCVCGCTHPVSLRHTLMLTRLDLIPQTDKFILQGDPTEELKVEIISQGIIQKN